jgi:RNA polymerase sigma-70 factor (ECF subfamily)
MNQNSRICQIQQRIAFYEDMKAYEELYYLFFDDLFRFAHTFTKSDQAAEEIVSDVFIKTWQIRTKLIEIENLRVYLYTITRNFSLNYISKDQRRHVVDVGDSQLELVADLKTPEELCISAEVMNEIRDAIKELPEQCRLIFQLVKLDGLRYKEVASILNISVFTVRNQVAKAVRRIAEALPSHIFYQ